jgi:hypothetical protein
VSARSVVAAAAAVVFALAAGVLIGVNDDGDSGGDAVVLGRQVRRSTTSTSPTSTTLGVTTTTLVPVAIVDQTTTTAVGPATTTTVHRTATTSPGPPTGRSVERADTTASFDYRPDGAGAMTVTESAPPRDPFTFKTFGSDVNGDGVAELRAEMANQTTRDIVFPDGLVLRFVITRDGQQWRTVELRFPDTQGLPPGGSLEVESATPLQEQYGRYEVTGEVTIEYR